MKTAMRKTLHCLSAMLLSASVCACGQGVNTSAASTSYVERQVDVCRGVSLFETPQEGKITLRFYDDQPNVAYASIKDYYSTVMEDSKEFDDPQMMVTKQADGTYLMKSETGEAVIDVESDVLTTDDITGFINQMSLEAEGARAECYDGRPFITPVSSEYEKIEVSYDMGKYDIDVRGEDDDVYFPVATISDLTSDTSLHYSVFNGENFYFCEDEGAASFSTNEDGYYDMRLENAAKGGTRPADLVDFTYQELCFNIDHFYGRPGRELLHEELERGDLESALEGLGESGKTIITLLKSDSYADYFAGITRLQGLLGDGGHTSLDSISENAMLDPDLMVSYVDISTTISPLFVGMNANEVNAMEDEVRMFARTALRNRILENDDETYVKQGDTAICIIDSFGCKMADVWNGYYQGTGEKPTLETLGEDRVPDAVLKVRDVLDRATADPEVKNLIIDISNNGGGSTDELLAVYAMLTGSSTVSMHSKNVYADVLRKETFEVDCNLDKAIDERDDVKPDLNIGVLTSKYTYSAANMFTLLMKEAGYPILGEQSGGGPCCIGAFGSPEGFIYSMSSGRARLSDEDGLSYDEGIPVDVDLLPRDESGNVQTVVLSVPEDPDYPEKGVITVTTPDYAEFYNLERLSREMNEAYGE